MNISDILSPECVLPDMDCHSKKDALDTLAKTIADSDSSISQTEVFDCLIARERLGSTGLGNGIAIPHGRLKNGKSTLAAFIQLDTPIDYDAVDNAPVDLLFALIVPEDSTEEHLQTLATLAEMFSDTATLRKLRRTNSSERIYAILTG
ncbi:MAG: PTS IIA-like nitrogen regulatory protein PtsN [Proteobacteria bacterium]|nr:PTS IIA-like nitrogen-regulatory protein PtsN [Pseudomonadota bacterium]NOG60734.1 PTS IIA-like nitrogen regulatory protein PtsN [Pseudomonadota bacterium]